MKTVFMVITTMVSVDVDFNLYLNRKTDISPEITGLAWSSREPWIFASLSYDGRVTMRLDALSGTNRFYLLFFCHWKD